MKLVLSSLSEVPEALRSEYEEKDGKIQLKLEGDYAPLVEANRRLVEFRDNNRALNTKVTELETNLKKFEGIDPTEHATLKARVAELEKGGVKKPDDVAEIVKAAVKAAVTPLESKIAERELSEAAARAEAARANLESKLRDAGMKAGIDERAMSDFVNRGTQVFKLVDGKPAARDGDKPVFSKKSPSEEMSMDEWADNLRQDAPFLFKPSKGGGAGGNNGNYSGPKKTIEADPLVFGQNIEGIAKGEVTVNVP
jgi:hypothetical protein